MATKSLATKNNTITSNEVIITSLKDGAYKQARATEGVESMAKYVMANCKGFPDEVSKEVIKELNSGYMLRYSERYPKKTYAVVNDHYLLIDGSNPELENNKEKVDIGVDYAFSFSQQQFGKLKSENPYLYSIVQPIRKEVQTYCSNRLGDLKTQVRKLIAKEKGVTRTPTKDFSIWLKETWLDNLETRAKNAKSKGDVTVDEDLIRKIKTLIK